MKFQITNRWTGSLVFEADIDASLESQPLSIRLGAAVKVAVKARSNLARANLAGADLAGSNLTGSNLARADLAGADLAGSNLTGSNLAGANLAGSNLAFADLAGADLARAKWRNGVTISRPPIFVLGLPYRVTILDAHMEIGCQIHRLSEWEAMSDEKIVEMDGRGALKLWRAWKGPLLAMAKADGRSFAAEEINQEPSNEAALAGAGGER